MIRSSVAHKRFTRLLHNLLWFEPFYLAILTFPLLLPSRFLPQSAHPYLLLLLFLFWPLRYFIPSHFAKTSTQPSYLDRLIPSPLQWPIVLILLWLPINLWVSANRAQSYTSAGYLLLGVAVYVALINWSFVQHRPRRLAQIIAFSGVGLACVAPFFTAWKVEFRLFRFPIYDLLRSLSLETRLGIIETIHANVLAGTLVIVLPILIVLALGTVDQSAVVRNYRGLSLSWPWVIGGALMLGVIALSQSRGAYLAVLLSVGLLCCFRWRKLLLGLSTGGVLAAVLLFYYGDPFAALDVIATDSALGGAEFRIDVWSNSLYAISDFIFTGIGIGTFNQIVPEFYPFAYVNGAFAHHAHNLYLQIALDIGVPGLIVYLLLMVGLMWMLVVVLRATPSVETRLLAIGAVGSLAAYLAHGLLDAVTWGTKLAFMPWMVFALITLLYKQTRQR